MRTQHMTGRDGRHIAAFVAGGLFYLVGTILVLMSFSPRQAVPLFMGAMFLCGGSVWVVVGAKYKKEAGQR